MDPVIVPRRREDFFKENGDPTLRFIRYLESLTITTNTASTTVVDNIDLINDNKLAIEVNAQGIDELARYAGLQSQIQFLQQQIDGLPEFTIDTTGFTVDSTLITVDKATA